jgi:cytoskeletal protein CcmA (bactofilin family)
MFSKSKDTAPAPSISNLPSAPAPKRAMRGTVPSIISGDLTVTGSLVSIGDVQIDGIVQGDVRSVGLVIGEKAEIHGEVVAEDVVVRGRVIGRIRARKVQLAATSHVEGDILHEAFSVDVGAFFEGNCRHSDNPLGDETRAPVPQAAPPSGQPYMAQIATLQPLEPISTPLTGLAGLTPVTQNY